VTAPPLQAPGSAELRAGETKVTIVPARGGKITSLVLAGREWLWTGEPSFGREAGFQVSDWLEAGFDECFPTIAACTLPAVAGRYAAIALPSPYSGLTLPERGELWSQRASFLLETREDGVYAACGWVGKRLPYRFARALQVHHDERIEIRYAVTNDGPDRLPFIWSAQPVLSVTKLSRIELPEGARVRVWSEHGINLGGPGAEHRWPRAFSAGKAFDLSRPETLGRAYACKLFVDMPAGMAAVEEPGARLEVSFDTLQVPYFGLTLHRAGGSSLVRRKSELQIGFGPSLGAPDSLTEAIGGWKSAAWLEPGETRDWTVTWRGIRLA